MPQSHRSLLARAVASLAIGVTALVPAIGGIPASFTASAAATVLPSVSVGDVSVTEGTGGTVTAVFTVTQSSAGKSTISYATANGTATSPADYLARSGSIRFAGKKLTRTVSVTVIADAIDEPNETFLLRLTGAKGATIADREGVGTITDDDPPPSVSVGPTESVPEGQTGDTSFASIHVTLSTKSAKDVSVDWTTADGTATVAGSDYTPDSGTLHFAPGETDKVVLLAVIGDNANEADETFDVNLSSPVNATVGNATDVVTIIDNDPIPPGTAVLSVKATKKREGRTGTTTLTFTVTRSGDTTTAVNVDYATSDGTAISPPDYAAANGNLPFAANQTSGTINVTVNGDRVLEHDETFFLSLLDPSAGAALSTGQATGTIVNDDTRTTVAVKVRAARKVDLVHGRVSPARAGKRVVVRLFRRHNGLWVRVRIKRALLRGSIDLNGDGFPDSRYSLRFIRTKPGSCKVVTTYPGDTRFSSSQAIKSFRC